MKTKNAKLFLLLFTAVIFALALVACGGAATPEPTAAPTSAPVEETAAEPTEAPDRKSTRLNSSH